MPPTRLRVLHAIHDFLPRHRAGSEIYAANLAAAEATLGHHVTVLCAEYDPTRAHGQVTWRIHDGLPVVEIVNNWMGRSFEETYRPALITERLGQVLDAVQPDVLHIHSLFNLSFDLPQLASDRGIPVVATLHDYTLVCPSGGQRVHRADSHVCETIDTERCARCFKESPFYAQLSVGTIAGAAPGGLVSKLASLARRRFPATVRRAASVARQASLVPVNRQAINTRLARAREVLGKIDLVIAPSQYLAEEFVRLGADRSRILVSANGQVSWTPVAVERPRIPLRIGFVGTIVWHKGVHVLIEAVKGLPLSGFDLRIFGSLAVAPEYVTQLRRASAGMPIRFEGEFQGEDLAHALSNLDVLVVPSLWPENAPLVIPEALHAGAVVVAARVGGIPEFVEDGVTGRLFNPRQPAELTRILAEMIENPERLAQLAGRSPTSKTIDRDARDWADRYDLVIGRRAMTGVWEPAS
jgi:glycosyltransferase involved in cell wall biosynthesis